MKTWQMLVKGRLGACQIPWELEDIRSPASAWHEADHSRRRWIINRMVAEKMLPAGIDEYYLAEFDTIPAVIKRAYDKWADKTKRPVKKVAKKKRKVAAKRRKHA